MKSLLVLIVLLCGMAVSLQVSAQDGSRQDWPVYPAKGMPLGTNVTEEEAFSLTERELTVQAHYLTGTFRVTASGEESVVLRTDGKPGGPRIVVAYPPSIPTPAEGAKLIRDETRGFLVTDVRHGANGEVTIFAREIILP